MKLEKYAQNVQKDIPPESVEKMWMSRGSALFSEIYKKVPYPSDSNGAEGKPYPLGMLSILCKSPGVNDCYESPHISLRIQISNKNARMHKENRIKYD